MSSLKNSSWRSFRSWHFTGWSINPSAGFDMITLSSSVSWIRHAKRLDVSHEKYRSCKLLLYVSKNVRILLPRLQDFVLARPTRSSTSCPVQGTDGGSYSAPLNFVPSHLRLFSCYLVTYCSHPELFPNDWIYFIFLTFTALHFLLHCPTKRAFSGSKTSSLPTSFHPFISFLSPSLIRFNFLLYLILFWPVFTFVFKFYINIPLCIYLLFFHCGSLKAHKISRFS